MKKSVLTIVAITIAALTGLSFTACHQRGAWYGEDDPSDQAGRERRINYVKTRVVQDLDLNDAQISELNRMIEELKAKHDALKSHRAEFKSEFIQTLGQDRLEADDIMRLIDARRPEVEDLLATIAEQIAEFHNMLNTEQRAKLIAELESHDRRCPFGR